MYLLQLNLITKLIIICVSTLSLSRYNPTDLKIPIYMTTEINCHFDNEITTKNNKLLDLSERVSK